MGKVHTHAFDEMPFLLDALAKKRQIFRGFIRYPVLVDRHEGKFANMRVIRPAHLECRADDEVRAHILGDQFYLSFEIAPQPPRQHIVEKQVPVGKMLDDGALAIDRKLPG